MYSVWLPCMPVAIRGPAIKTFFSGLLRNEEWTWRFPWTSCTHQHSVTEGDGHSLTLGVNPRIHPFARTCYKNQQHCAKEVDCQWALCVNPCVHAQGVLDLFVRDPHSEAQSSPLSCFAAILDGLTSGGIGSDLFRFLLVSPAPPPLIALSSIQQRSRTSTWRDSTSTKLK